MDQLFAILASVTVVSLISFVGAVFVGLKEDWLKRLLMGMVGFASGSLLAGAFIDLLPEALGKPPEGLGLDVLTALAVVVAGIVVFFGMEKFLYWRHCHEEDCKVHTFAYTSLAGDGVHNFIDGMIIAGAFLAAPDMSLGIATTLAVVFHEIPQEIGDFGVLIYGGFGKRKALMYNFASALTAVFGALLTYSLAFVEGFYALLVPFAAGGFIYIAATDLMPELHKKSQAKESVVQFLAILAGIGLMAYLALAIRG